MAKSLRASSKVKARNARRYTPGNDYTVTHAARLNAISTRLSQRMKAQSTKQKGKEADAIRDADADAESADAKDNRQGWSLARLRAPETGLCSMDGHVGGEKISMRPCSLAISGVDLQMLGLVNPDALGFADMTAGVTERSGEEPFLWMFGDGA